MSPLPAADFGLPREEYVIVPVAGGKVDGSVLHTPRDKIEPDESPMEATSWCGVTGWVYVRGGAFERRPACTECVAAEQELGCDPRTGSLIARYNDGCRCWACRGAMRAYRKEYFQDTEKAARLQKECPDCGTKILSRSTRCKGCHNRARKAGIVCGSESMYSMGCTCTPCRDAHAAYHRQKRADRKAA